MSDESRTQVGTPTPEELREQVERTREELGQTVEALAHKADIKAQAHEKTAAVRKRAAAETAVVADQVRANAQHAVQLVKDRTPDRFLDQAAQASGLVVHATARAGQLVTENTPHAVLDRAGQAATAARANRKPLIVAGAALVVATLLVRHRHASR